MCLTTNSVLRIFYTRTNFMSSFTASINLLFGLPPGLLPATFNLSILLRRKSQSFPHTSQSPKHLNFTVPEDSEGAHYWSSSACSHAWKREVQHFVLLPALPPVFYLVPLSLSHATLILSQCFIHFSYHYYWYSLIPHHSDSFLYASQTACTRYFTSFPHFRQWQPNSCLCAGLSIFSKLHFSIKPSFRRSNQWFYPCLDMIIKHQVGLR